MLVQKTSPEDYFVEALREGATISDLFETYNGKKVYKFVKEQDILLPTYRPFGVELELVFLNSYSLEKAANVAARVSRLTVTPSTRSAGVSEFWKAVPDGSIKYNGGEYPAELVSPIIRSREDIERVLKPLCLGLTKDEVRNDPSCGFHVHIEFPSKGPKERAEIYKLLLKYQDELFKLIPKHRRDNNYCRKLAIREAEATMYNNKYAAIAARGDTVEFRMHAGTYSYHKVINWVNFLQLIVNHCHQLLTTKTAQADVKPLPLKELIKDHPLLISHYNELKAAAKAGSDE